VASGNARSSETASASASTTYYPKYTGKSDSIVDALAAVGETDTSKTHRTKIAAANGITGYKGSATQNTQLLVLLKNGKLKKA
jgi:multimeric flavodoxin WrbA